MKCLYFEDDGYCIWAKRWEQGAFRVRWDGEEKARIDLSTADHRWCRLGFGAAI